jgi:hypothetical protein
MAYSPVDKFLCVAKILTDARLQELVEENRKLKLALFWKTYDIRQLRNRIRLTIQDRLNCKCKSCHFNGESDGDFNGEWECAVTRRFQDIAREHGLSTAQENGDETYSISVPELGAEMDDEAQIFCAGDVHIVLQSSVVDWVVLGYGEKLTQAKSTEDPELIKLKKLFETLEA